MPLRDPRLVLFTDDVGVARVGGGWVFTVRTTDVNSMLEEDRALTDEQLVACGPPARMTAAALEELARTLGRDPSSLAWCRDRRLLERIVADAPVDGELPPLLDGEPPLTVALGVAAWKVAAALIERGAVLSAPPGTVWEKAGFAVAALDDSDGAAAVLARLLARRRLALEGGVLRHARSPRVARALIDAGARPNASGPTGGDGAFDPELWEATPLAVAAVSGRFEVAAALLDGGASLEARDAQGRTALILAVRWGNEAPVRWLIDRGALVKSAADAHGRTPTSLALARPNDAGSRVLLAAR